MIILDVAIALINLTGPDGRIVQVNPAQVVTLRRPSSIHGGHFHRSVRCVLFTADGKFAAVVEDCDTVQHLLGAHDEVPP